MNFLRKVFYCRKGDHRTDTTRDIELDRLDGEGKVRYTRCLDCGQVLVSWPPYGERPWLAITSVLQLLPQEHFDAMKRAGIVGLQIRHPWPAPPSAHHGKSSCSCGAQPPVTLGSAPTFLGGTPLPANLQDSPEFKRAAMAGGPLAKGIMTLEDLAAVLPKAPHGDKSFREAMAAPQVPCVRLSPKVEVVLKEGERHSQRISALVREITTEFRLTTPIGASHTYLELAPDRSVPVIGVLRRNGYPRVTYAHGTITVYHSDPEVSEDPILTKVLSSLKECRSVVKDNVYLAIARTVSNLGTCCRLKVGCVLLTKEGRVAGIGYNGAGPGMPHCVEDHCNSTCRCIRTLHAEQNALFSRNGDPAVAYVTHEPCLNCTKELAVAGVRRVVYGKPYTSIADDERKSRQEWIDHYHISWEPLGPLPLSDGELREH